MIMMKAAVAYHHHHPHGEDGSRPERYLNFSYLGLFVPRTVRTLLLWYEQHSRVRIVRELGLCIRGIDVKSQILFTEYYSKLYGFRCHGDQCYANTHRRRDSIIELSRVG